MPYRSHLSRIWKLWAKSARGLLAAALLFVGLAPAASWGSSATGDTTAGMVYYVDTNHPQASDSNPQRFPAGHAGDLRCRARLCARQAGRATPDSQYAKYQNAFQQLEI